MTRIIIRRIFVVEDIVPFDDDHYPGMTPQQAAEYERNLAHDEVMDLLVNGISNDEVTVESTSVEVID